MRSTGVHHVDLVVSDIDRSLRFYRGVLGPLGWHGLHEIPGEQRRDDQLHPRAGLDDRPAQAPDGAETLPVDRYRVGMHHLCLEAATRELLYESADRIVALGGTISEGPRHYPEYREGYHAVFFFDPDGIKLELSWTPAGDVRLAGAAASRRLPRRGPPVGSVMEWRTRQGHECDSRRWAPSSRCSRSSPRRRPQSRPRRSLTWQTNGRVNAIMQIGGVTYVGGKFTQVSSHNGATTATVSNLAAFDTNGNFTNWAPVANGTVKTFATDGAGAIIAGGSFTKINSAGRPHVAEILANGTLVPKTTWGATADGDVQALATSGSTLYMGGQFANVDGQPRAFLGAVSLTDGTIDSSWQPFVDGRVDGLETVAANVIAGGFFLNAGSAAGGHASLAAFDGTTGAFVSSYNGHTSSAVVSMAEGGDGSIYTGHFNNRMQRFTPAGGSSWQIGFDGNVQAITVSDGEVIAGGHFQNLCDVGTNCANPIVRHHIAALDPATGALDATWAPSVNSDLGVFALADTSLGLAAGGDFTNFGGRRPGPPGVPADGELRPGRCDAARRSPPRPTRSCGRPPP